MFLVSVILNLISFSLKFSPFSYIIHSALFHFRRQFRTFCRILSLGVFNWPCFRLYMFHASHINVIWSLHRHSVSNLSLVQRTPTQLSRKEIYCCFCCARVKTPHASLTFDTRTASGCSFIRALIANSLLRLRCLVLVSSSVTSLFLRLRTGSCQVISGILLQFGFSSLPMAFSSLLRSSMNSRYSCCFANALSTTSHVTAHCTWHSSLPFTNLLAIISTILNSVIVSFLVSSFQYLLLFLQLFPSLSLLDSSFTHTFPPHAPAPVRRFCPADGLSLFQVVTIFHWGGGKCHRGNCVVSSLYYNLVL